MGTCGHDTGGSGARAPRQRAQRTTGRRGSGAAAVAIALALVLAACSGSSGDGDGGGGRDGEGRREQAGEAGGTTSTTLDPRAPAVLEAYDGYWAALLVSADPPNPDSQALARHATGDELERARSAISELQRAGDVMRGSYGHEAAIARIDDAEAVVTDCLAPRTTIHDSATGELTLGESSGASLVTVQMVLDGERWKVALIEDGEGACPTGAGAGPPREAPAGG